MRLLSLEVEHFRAIQEARLQFGPGLNVVHGPNDRGKSTLTEAIRAALLVAPASVESRSFATWGAPAGQLPRVILGFECDGAAWQVEKVFGQGTRAKAYLRKSADGGVRYHAHAEGRDVDGKLRELLNWGLAPPGGKGKAQRPDTFLTTALLGKQGEVSAIFDASLKVDQDDTGRALVTRALDALGQHPDVTRLLERLKERSEEAYSASGRLKRSADSPLVRARTALKEREDRLRSLEESARQGKEVEEQVRNVLRQRETALEGRDQARAALDKLREQAAAADQREQLDRAVSQHLREHDRVAAAFSALETARLEHAQAEAALASIGTEWQEAVDIAQSAAAAAQSARERLARAQAAHASSRELETAERGARVSELRALRENARARKAAAHAAVTAINELDSLEAKLVAAQVELNAAGKEAVRASAELDLALALEEHREASALAAAVTEAAAEHGLQSARESAASAAVREADAAVKAASEKLDNARNADEHAQRDAETHAMNIRVLDTKILHCEAAARDEREALARARAAVERVRQAEQAQAAAAAAEARAAEIDASLGANADEIARAEARLRALESMSLELRRRAAVTKADELSAREVAARDHRRRAAEARERAARMEAEATGVRLPSPQQLASLRAMQAEIKSRKSANPAAASPQTALVLLAAAAGAAIGFAAARYGTSAGTGVSIGAALMLSVVAAVIAALASVCSQKGKAEVLWRAESERLESRLARETEPVLSEAGVSALDEIDSRRLQVQTLRTNAEGLRQEAAGLDREADSMFEIAAGLASLRRELETLDAQLASRNAGPAMDSEVLAGGQQALNEQSIREQDQLDRARRIRDELRTEQLRQVTVCASTRVAAERALAERGEALSSSTETAIADAESRWRSAEAQLTALREERRQAAGLEHPAAASVSQIDLGEAEQAAAIAVKKAADLRGEHQAVVHDLARATARLELARRAADAISLPEIEARVVAARAVAEPGEEPGAEPPDSASAKSRHERARERVSIASTSVELVAAEIPQARRKVEALQPGLPSGAAAGAAAELASAEAEECRLEAELRDAEIEVPDPAGPDSFSARELRDAEQAAGIAEQALTDLRARAAALTDKRAELTAAAERARGESEASNRQTLGMDLAAAQAELAKARQALDGTEPAVDVSPSHLEQFELALESRNHALTACEGRLNELRGKLELVAGRVGIERLEEEQEAVQRAKEYAEEQELDYEATKHLMESLEAAEAKRSSHLGRCLAAPVTERFLALTGDFYAHVQLDPDLRMEGFMAAGEARRVEELSVGTREQLATIVRLAIAAQLKTAVLLDDQLVHSDSERLDWFRKQVRNSVHAHDHQVIVMTCRLSDYAAEDEISPLEGTVSPDGSPPTIINILEVLQRVEA
jgi:DNA repair exonuclease SbcCD ATPase subunit